LIANLIGYLQWKGSVTTSEGKNTATGYISDFLHKDKRLFLQQIGQSPNTNLRYAECMSLKRGK